MKRLGQLIPLTYRSNSLLVTLIISFLSIIVLLVMFHFISISLSVGKVKNEVVKYNVLNLSDTITRYEKHFELIHQTMLTFMINDSVQNFRRDPQFIQFPNIQQQINQLVQNPQLHIYDIVLYDGVREQILDKNASTSAEWKFDVFMASDQYPASFWKKEEEASSYLYRVLPEAAFLDYNFRSSPSTVGSFLPIVYKSHQQSPFFMVVFLDAHKMFEEFHVSINNNLLVVDEKEALFYRGAAQPFDDFQQTVYLNGEEGQEKVLPRWLHSILTYSSLLPDFIEHEGYYYFFGKGASSGFTYVNAIPLEEVSAQDNFRWILLVILLGSILFGGLFAYWFIKRINHPLTAILQSIQSMNMNAPAKGRFREFETIWEQFKSIHTARQQMDKELQSQALERQRFGYIHELKQFHPTSRSSLSFTNKPFYLLAIDIHIYHFDQAASDEIGNWSRYVKEFIDLSLVKEFPESVTLQMEKDQLISIIFTSSLEQIRRQLEKIKVTIDLDSHYGALTLAVSEPYTHSNQLTEAYEEVNAKLEQRLLGEKTEIIYDFMPAMPGAAYTADQEWELDLLVREDQIEKVMEKCRQYIVQWDEQGVPAARIVYFCQSILQKLQRKVSLDAGESEEARRLLLCEKRLHHCPTRDQLLQTLQEGLQQYRQLLESTESKQSDDPITGFVLDYLNENYDQEIYLESMAQKLNITASYLSSYFKEKTGENFIDYLNRLRIAKAREFLLQSDDRIHLIAEKVGYQNLNSFNRMFKKFTGLTPSEYRKQRGNSSS